MAGSSSRTIKLHVKKCRPFCLIRLLNSVIKSTPEDDECLPVVTFMTVSRRQVLITGPGWCVCERSHEHRRTPTWRTRRRRCVQGPRGNHKHPPGPESKRAPIRARPERQVCGDTSGSFRAICCFQTSSSSTDGQLAANLSWLGLQRGKKENAAARPSFSRCKTLRRFLR